MTEPGKGTEPPELGMEDIHPARWRDQPSVIPEPGARYRTTNGLATWSLVMAILWGFGFFSLFAVLFGHQAKAQIKRRGQDGASIATAGLILGYLGLAVPVLLGFLFLLGVMAQ
jgi:Domain of unknown function (DUF4190)